MAGSNDDSQAAEDVPLLAQTKHTPHQTATASSSIAPAAGSPRATTAVCRICLEEDDLDKLEQPCSCSGTVSYAHHDCLQKWVATKGDKMCELCKQEYKGDFELPPPAPPSQPLEHVHFVGIRSVYLNPDGTVQREEEVLFDEDEALDERRRSSIQWCLTFILFTTLLLLLHHSMAAADVSGQPLPPPDDPASMDAGDFESSTSLLWILTRMLLIGLPLYMVMRAAQEARRAALHAHLQMVRGVPAGISFLVPPASSRWQELTHMHQGPPLRQHAPAQLQAGPDNV